MRTGRHADGGNVQRLKEPINFQPLWAVNSSVPADNGSAGLGRAAEKFLLIGPPLTPLQSPGVQKDEVVNSGTGSFASG